MTRSEPVRDASIAAPRSVLRLAETASTNTAALEWSRALSWSDLPVLVTAERQTAGRGRGANQWWSDPGALTFSLVIEPAAYGVPVARWPALSLTVGASVAAAVTPWAAAGDVRLKWPNDVFLNGRKLGGVLIESPPDQPARMVIGVGLNVNNSLAQAPPEVRARGISLCDAAGGPLSVEDVLAAVLRQLADDVAALARNDAALVARWRRACLLSGRSIVVADGSRVVSGTCLGIDDDGALRVQSDRHVERLFSGVVVDYGGA